MQVVAKNKKKNTILVIVFAIIIVAVAYFLYTEYWPEKEGVLTLGEENVTIQEATVVADLSMELLETEKFVNLKPYGITEYVTQYSGVATNQEKPAPPSSIRVLDLGVGGTLDIFWQEPANYPEAATKIYRSTSSGKLGKVIAENLEDDHYRDRDLINSTTYFYTVRTVIQVSGESKESNNTTQSSGVPTDVTAPAPPTNVIVDNPGTGGTLEISWQNPLDNDFSHVNIYRSQKEGMLGELIKDYIEDTSYQNTGLQDNITYYYTLTAVDTSGNESSIYLSRVSSGRTNPFEAF